MGSKPGRTAEVRDRAEVSAKVASFGYMNKEIIATNYYKSNNVKMVTRPHVPHDPEYNPYKLYVGLR